ncbi:MAG: DUF3164 family protein [Pedobacter sp.]
MEIAVKEISAEGYMEDSKGRLVPLCRVSQIDKERDALVREIVIQAQSVAAQVAAFKTKVLGDIEAFVDLSAERFDVKLGGAKGNVSLLSYDGCYKVQRAIDDYLVFDERLQIAKALIDDCINTWSEGSREEIRMLINDAFQVDQQGKVNVKRILGLRRLPITDKRWLKAMDAIGESIQVTGSKTYVRVYERMADGSFKQISLDVSK